MMGTEMLKSLYCDGCQNVDNHGESIRDLRADAKKNGWIYSKGKDLCPKCQEDDNAA